MVPCVHSDSTKLPGVVKVARGSLNDEHMFKMGLQAKALGPFTASFKGIIDQTDMDAGGQPRPESEKIQNIGISSIEYEAALETFQDKKTPMAVYKIDDDRTFDRYNYFTLIFRKTTNVHLDWKEGAPVFIDDSGGLSYRIIRRYDTDVTFYFLQTNKGDQCIRTVEYSTRGGDGYDLDKELIQATRCGELIRPDHLYP